MIEDYLASSILRASEPLDQVPHMLRRASGMLSTLFSVEAVG